MPNTIPFGKLLMLSLFLAAVGYLLVSLLGMGLADNGAIAMALGLFLGGLLTPILLNLPAKKKVRSKTAVSQPNSSETGIISIFVGNLAFKVRGRQLAELFEPYGPIESIRIVKDHNTGRGKGFGFVDMKANAARKAIAELDGQEFFGRQIKVSEANAQKD